MTEIEPMERLATYDDLTWPQVEVMATISRTNRDGGVEITEPVSVIRNRMNLNSVWALVRKGVVDLDSGTGEVWVRVEYVALANYCRERVEERVDRKREGRA